MQGENRSYHTGFIYIGAGLVKQVGIEGRSNVNLTLCEVSRIFPSLCQTVCFFPLACTRSRARTHTSISKNLTESLLEKEHCLVFTNSADRGSGERTLFKL